MLTYLEELESAIVKAHGVAAMPAQVVPVEIEGWAGNVVVFKLKNHPQAKTCYAWSIRFGEGLKVKTMLGAPPVNSAENAVGYSMVMDSPPDY